MKKFIFIIISLFLLSGCHKSDEQITTIIENSSNILIGINYPITDNKKLNNIIKSDVEKTYSSFKNKYQNFHYLKEKVELNIDYKFQKMNRYYVVLIDTYQNNSTLEEKENIIKTYIYDTKTSKLLNLKDIIFKDDLIYITKEIKKQLSKENCFYGSTLKPDYLIYSNFTFDQDYIYFYFDSKSPLKSCSKKEIKIPLDSLNLKIEIEQDIINTMNYKVKVPSKTLDPNKKYIALTFDDGPSIYTKKILNILKKNNSNATFFVLGNKVEIYKDTIIKTLENGNEIGNHSYSHKWLIKLDEKALKEQIYKTQDIIKESTGYTPTLLRPTYGSVNNKIKNLNEFKIVLWNVDTLDWKYKNINRIVSRATKNAKDGNIILMHDIHLKTAKALEKIIPILKDEGFELVTISELEMIKNIRNKTKTNY